MNSKEAINYLSSDVFTGGNSILKEEAEVCKNIILQDLDKLEELEKILSDLKSMFEIRIGIDCGNEYFIEIIKEWKNRKYITMNPIRLEVESTDLFKQNIELRKAIQQAVELLSVDGKGTKQEVKKLLSKVLKNV